MENTFVRVYKAAGEPEAGLIEFLLTGAQIPVRIRRNSLSGLGGEIPFEETYVEVLVPPADLPRALQLIREKKQEAADESPGPLITCPACGAENESGFAVCWNCQADLETGQPATATAPTSSPELLEQTGSPKTGWTSAKILNVVLFAALGFLGLFTMRLAQNQPPGDEHPHFRFEWNALTNCSMAFWRESGNQAFVECDKDGSGKMEVYRELSFDGNVQCEYHDKNENGIFESLFCFGPSGTKTLTSKDRDEDGFFEISATHYPYGDLIQYDLDGDHLHEYRVHRDAGGKIIGTFEDLGPEGIRPVPPRKVPEAF